MTGFPWFALPGVIARAQALDTGIPASAMRSTLRSSGSRAERWEPEPFGRVTSTRIDDRQIQAAPKYTF